MNTRFVSAAAALVLTLAAPASSAFAQSYTAPAGLPTAVTPGGYGTAPHAYDDVTTGSIGRRTPDSSAKAGNADENDKPVWNTGSTSGGPAY